MSSSLVHSSARIHRTSPSLPLGADPHPHTSPALPNFLQDGPSSCFSESAIWNPRSWSYCIHLFLELLSFVGTFKLWKDHPVTWPQRDLKRRDVFPPEFKQTSFVHIWNMFQRAPYHCSHLLWSRLSLWISVGNFSINVWSPFGRAA